MVARYVPKKPISGKRIGRPPKEKIPVVEGENVGGRPTTYHASYPQIARQLCAMGATDTVLADAFDVSSTTIFAWQTRHPEFRQAVVEGKTKVFDPLVERALAQLAIGYSIDTEEIKIIDGRAKKVPIRKHFPPNITAIQFWLKNRKPEMWSDMWKVEHDGKIDMQNLTSAQLLEQIRKEAGELGIVPEELAKASGVLLNGTGKTKH